MPLVGTGGRLWCLVNIVAMTVTVHLLNQSSQVNGVSFSWRRLSSWVWSIGRPSMTLTSSFWWRLLGSGMWKLAHGIPTFPRWILTLSQWPVSIPVWYLVIKHANNSSRNIHGTGLVALSSRSGWGHRCRQSHTSAQGLTCYLLKAGSQTWRTTVSDKLATYVIYWCTHCEIVDSAWQLSSSKKEHQLLANQNYSVNNTCSTITSIIGARYKSFTWQEWPKYTSHNPHSYPYQLLHIQSTRCFTYHCQSHLTSSFHPAFLVSFTLSAIYMWDRLTMPWMRSDDSYI